MCVQSEGKVYPSPKIFTQISIVIFVTLQSSAAGLRKDSITFKMVPFCLTPIQENIYEFYIIVS